MIPVWGAALAALWGLVHLALTGRMARLAAAGGADPAALLRREWVSEGLFLLFIALLGGVFARPLLSRDLLAMRLYKVLALGLMALAAWHNFGPPPENLFGRLYTPVLTLAAALILVPLYLPAPETLRRDAGKRRGGTSYSA